MKQSFTIDRDQMDDVVTFLAVAECRGFRAAAVRLGVTPSAVSQSIRALENRVGSPLFIRTTRSVNLTEAGERLLVHAKPAAELLSQGLSAAAESDSQIRGYLRINAPTPALPYLVNRLVPRFMDEHSNLQLEITGDDRPVDIVAEGYDAGIRLGDFVETDMISVRLTSAERFVVVGSPAFLKRHGSPSKPADLNNYPCILYRRETSRHDHWRFRVRGRAMSVMVKGPLILNDVDACIRAAIRGGGLFWLPRSLVLPHIEAGLLTTILEAHGEDVPGLALYYPSSSRKLLKIKALVSFATKHLRDPARDSDCLYLSEVL